MHYNSVNYMIKRPLTKYIKSFVIKKILKITNYNMKLCNTKIITWLFYKFYYVAIRSSRGSCTI